jgi:ABC-type transport system substrate-binding protein
MPQIRNNWVLRILRPGGTLFIGILPNEDVKTLEFTKHGFTLYDPEAAAVLLTKAGFKDTRYLKREDPPMTFRGKENILTSCCVMGRT